MRPLPQRVRARLGGEQGFALVMALALMVVLTVASTTAIYVTSSSSRGSGRSSANQTAYSLAEAGIADVSAILNLPANNALDPTVFCSSPGQTQPCTITVPRCPSAGRCYDSGSNTYWGVLDTTFGIWTITSQGTVPNPDPTLASMTRTITTHIAVHPTLTQPLNTPIWDYMYATGPMTSGCDMTLVNSVTVASPLYVEGNLCMTNTATITKGPLVVKGQLSVTKSGNYVGTSGTPISDAHIGNLCSYLNATPTTCTKDGTQHIWANTLDTTPPSALTPPTVSWQQWYINASPGPYFPCDPATKVGTPPVFDTPVGAMTDTDATKDTYRNNNQGNQNLTPASAYTCKTTAGELSWNPAPGAGAPPTLTIKGTIFIDGSAYITNGLVNLYKGQGVIYLSGTLQIQGASLCGAIYNGACDTRAVSPVTSPRTCPPTTGWDPNCSLIAFIANGSGGQDPIGDGIWLKSGSLQGAAYATSAIEVGTSSSIAGPLVGSTIILSQSTTTSFPSIQIVPAGMPSNPTAYAQPDPPADYTG